MRKHYTRKNLIRNELAYLLNYRFLKATVGTPKHKEYAKIEQRLELENNTIRKALGIYLPNPCPIMKMHSRPCRECTGWFLPKRIKKGRIHKVVNVQVRPNVSKKARLCPLKASLI